MVGMRQRRRQMGYVMDLATAEFLLPAVLVVDRRLEELVGQGLVGRLGFRQQFGKQPLRPVLPFAALTAIERRIAWAIGTVTLRSPSRTVMVR
jgi:hypothetical protein